MALVLILTLVIFLWYCAKELRFAKPNLARAINSTLFWPFSIFFNTSGKTEE